MSDLDRPKISVQEMQNLLGAELSSRSRFGYTALLVATLGFAGVMSSLWLTEPSLPVRTQAGFGLLVAINLFWAGFAFWVVTRRRVLLAGHSVIAGLMAVIFSTVLVVFFLVLGALGQVGRPAYAAAGSGLVMLIVALAVLTRARRRFRELTERRRVLELEVEKGQTSKRPGGTS